MYLLLFAVLALLEPAWSIPIDNGLDGEPEIQCGSSNISVVFSTRKPFEGYLYAKEQFDKEGCVVSSFPSPQTTLTITLPFYTCNVLRERSLNPLGVFASATVVVQFHPQFNTKVDIKTRNTVDKVFTFQCFYMEADKTVSHEFEVSPLTNALKTEVVPMPVCRYEILDGRNGTLLKYVVVGEGVYHKWTCESDTTDALCMTVHSCFVDDGTGDRADLLDEIGCAQDIYLLRNLDYLTDLTAGQEAHAFKFSRGNKLFFQCQITIAVKEPGDECTTPTCSFSRQRRSSYAQEMAVGTVDVTAILDALPLMEGQTFDLERLAHKDPPPSRVVIFPPQPKGSFCLSLLTLGISVSLVLSCLFSTAFSCTMLFIRSSSK